MTTIAETHPPLSQSRLAVRAAWITGFAVLTGLGAWVEIPLPFTPVPITLQTLVVLASGVVLGRDGLYSQLLYLLLGGIGLPMFAGGSAKWIYLFSASGGYLIGFVAASAIAGRWVHPIWNRLSFWGRTWRLLAISLAIFIPGVLQLALVLKASLWQALVWGFFPFIVGDILKTFITASIPSKALRN